jgi:hypothetical protein
MNDRNLSGIEPHTLNLEYAKGAHTGCDAQSTNPLIVDVESIFVVVNWKLKNTQSRGSHFWF